MLFFRKGFTLLEIIIVLALTGLFIAAASYLNRDTRTYQANAERLANYVDTSLRTAKSNMTLGRGVMSGSTLVTTDKRTISIRGTGITTTYGTTNTGTESSLTWPFYDSDTAYQITDISVSSGILMNGQMPIWDQTGVTMADITVLPNGDFQVFSSSVATPIRILRITAGYAGFERSVMIDTVMGRTTSVQGRGEVDYIPAPPAPPPNSCAATPSFVNIGSTNVGSPTTAGQGWYYSTTPGNCSYDCINGFKGASCLTPPTPTCDINPSFPNLGTLTTGSPSSVSQAWYYSATPGDCTYACSNGYTGNNCLTAPVNGCAANPTYPNIGILTTGSPTSWNQAWTYNATPGTCTYDCTGGYSGPSCATAPFVTNFTTTWKVGTAGYGNGDNIVRFSVWRNASSVIDWGDGTIEPITTGTPSHFYLTPGDYTIVMSNITYFGAESYSANYHGKLISVDSWGGIAWGSMMSMFANADNLISLPAASPNTTGVTSMYGMFINTKAFNPAVLNLDTSHVTNMSSMFAGASIFNGSLASFDTSHVTDMSFMFSFASAFNKPITNFNTTNVTNMSSMFSVASAFNQSVTNFDTSNVTNMAGMFTMASAFNQSVANFDTSKVTSMSFMFAAASNFNQSVANFNTSNVTNMASMFWMVSPFNQSVANFDTSKVTNMQGMFGSTSFNQSVANFNTSNVTDMNMMFISSPFNQSVANFDTSKVTNMYAMFGQNSAFNQSVANFNTSNVTNMSSMFWMATAFNQSLTNFDTSKVVNMGSMFQSASLFNQDISNWCVTLIGAKPTNFDLSGNAGFVGNTAKQPQWGTCPAAPVVGFTTTWKVGAPGYGNGDNTVSFYLNTSGNYTIDWGDGNIETLSVIKPTHTYATAGDKTIIVSGNVQRFYPTNDIFNETAYPGKLTAVTDWGNMAWTSFDWMFFNANHLTSLPVTAPNLTNVTSMYRTFFYASNFNQDISNWNTSNVTSMWLTFNGASSFNQPLNAWDMSHVTTIYGMFNSATAFNQPLNSWNTSSVVDMGAVFLQATSFNQPLASWNMSSTTNISSMFYGATAFNQPLASWDVSHITNMEGVFVGASSFNQPLNSWNTSNVTSMRLMFFNATAFNQPLASWDTTKVINISYMFNGATAFNQPLNSWNTSNTIDMQKIFQSATAFNQSLDAWDTTKVTNMSDMFQSASNFNQDISNWCVTLIPSKPAGFDNASNVGFRNIPAKQPQWGTCPVAPVVGFTTTWKVGTPGYGNGDNTVSFNITRLAGSRVDWGDGTIESLSTDTPSHTYAIAGDYTIKISKITRFYTTSLASAVYSTTIDSIYAGKLLSVNDWGNMAWTDMTNMLNSADHLTALPILVPNMTNVTSMDYMFHNARLFNQDISSWDVSHVTSMMGTFSAAFVFNQPLNSWNMSNVTIIGSMFYEAKAFNQPLNSWNTSNVVGMYSVFSNAIAFNQPLNSWNTSSAMNMSSLFSYASSFNQDISSWNTSNVTNMGQMFQNATVFNQPVPFDTSKVTAMYSMFQNATAFNQSVSSFDTSKVTNMSFMFQNATAFNQSVSNFNTSNVTSMTNMFMSASAFNQPVPFDTSKVTSMSFMFANCVNFNQSLASFDTSNVQYMDRMFLNDFVFNQPLSNFDTSKVITMRAMFQNAYIFNQPLNSWNTSSALYMDSMFYGTAFNQPLNSWNTSNVVDMTNMFAWNASFNQNLSSWIVNPKVVTCTGFNNSASAWILPKPVFSNCTP